MPDSAGKYPYKPLDSGQIRLIVLRPDTWDSPLRCNIVHTPISDGSSIEKLTKVYESNRRAASRLNLFNNDGERFVVPSLEYETVSYTWGKPFKPCKLECAGTDFLVANESTSFQIREPPNRVPYLDITANLDSLLRHVRHPSDCKVFWIDAICINQEDLEEKLEQVMLMKKIFSFALRTIVWLGDEDEATPAAFSCIRLLRKMYNNKSQNARQPLLDAIARTNGRPWLLPLNHEGYIKESHWLSFEQLLSFPWFSRVWVFQEITVSRLVDVKCGGQIVPWSHLSQACDAVESLGIRIRDRYGQPLHTSVLIMDEAKLSHETPILEVPLGALAPKAQRATYQGFEGLSYPRLDTMLLLMRWAQATDARDKVYALLGICSGFDKKILRPDYTTSLRTTYTNVAMVLQRMKGLSAYDFLSFVQHASPALTTELPSWTPDWSRPLNAPWLILNSGFKTANKTRSDVVSDFRSSFFSQSHDTLYVRGVSLMRVAFLSTRAGSARKNPPPTELDGFPNPYGVSYAQAYDEGITPEHIFLGCPITQSGRVNFWKHMSQHGDHLEQTTNSDEKRKDSEYELEVDAAAWDRADGIQGISHGRKFFVTDLGFIGLAPLATIVGDLVVVFHGAKVPYILRRADGDYKFVGECYVYGMMDGEVFDDYDETQDRDFRIV